MRHGCPYVNKISGCGSVHWQARSESFGFRDARGETRKTTNEKMLRILRLARQSEQTVASYADLNRSIESRKF